MNIIIVGYGEMLKALILGVINSEHKIAGVFRHDNIIYPKWKRILYDIFKPSDDLNFIKTLKLPEIKADSVNSKKFRDAVKKLDADIILTGSWSEKFSLETINSPNIACINTHPSLLPLYKGPNPYLQVILHNEEETGVTFHLMNKDFDAGAILYQSKVPVFNNDTGRSLKLRCCDCAREHIGILLNSLEKKLSQAQEQDNQTSNYFPHITLSETILDFQKETASEIDRRIRALTPWSCCYICYKNEFFSFKYHIITKRIHNKIGIITDKGRNSISVSAQDGSIIKFSGLKIKRPFSEILTPYFLKYFVKINTTLD